MATFAEFKQTMDDQTQALVSLVASIGDLATRIQAMQAGQVMTQAELDALNAQAQAALTTVQDAATQVGALAPPAPRDIPCPSLSARGAPVRP